MMRELGAFPVEGQMVVLCDYCSGSWLVHVVHFTGEVDFDICCCECCFEGGHFDELVVEKRRETRLCRR